MLFCGGVGGAGGFGIDSNGDAGGFGGCGGCGIGICGVALVCGGRGTGGGVGMDPPVKFFMTSGFGAAGVTEVGGVGGAGGLGTADTGEGGGMGDAVGAVIWLMVRDPPLAVGAVMGADLNSGTDGFGAGLFAPPAELPNSKTAGRIGVWAGLFPKLISAPLCGLVSVNPAFFSAALNVVSSCSITGAGTEAGVIGFGGSGTGTFSFGAVGDIFDHPTSERMVSLGVVWVLLGTIFCGTPVGMCPILLSGE